MSNRSPSVSPLASPLRRMQAAGLTGRINPYCSRRANFRNVKEVKACLAAISDTSMITRVIKPPSSIHSIRTPPNRRSTHNVITPEARSMMKEAVAEFSSPLTDVKKIPIRDSPLFPIPASKRRKLFDMRDNILREVELKQSELKNKKKINKNENEIDSERKDAIETPIRLNADQELQKIQELYPEFRFSNPISLKSKSVQKSLHNYDGEFVFSSTLSANVIKLCRENASELESRTSKETAKQPIPIPNISDSTPTLPIITVDKELAARFRPPEGSWECGDCMINNQSNVNTCVACSAPRTISSAMQPQPKIHVEPDKELAARFRMGSDKWECGTCMIQNSQSDSKCLACDEPKPGTEVPKEKEKRILPLFTGTKTSTTTGLFNLKPGTGSGSSLFQGGLTIPGFSLTTKPTEGKTNPISTLLPSNPISNTLLRIPTIQLPATTANPISSSILPITNPIVVTTSTLPGISTNILSNTGNTANSSIHIQLTNPTAITTTSPTTAKSTADTPAVSLALPFTPHSLAPQPREDTTTTTSSLPLTQSTPSLQPIVMPPFSPPRSSHLAPPMLPLTPQKSVDEEAMEVIPFIGTLTTPIKGSSSQPTNSPFTFQLNNPTNPIQPTPPNFSAINSQTKFPGIQPLASSSFQFSKNVIPSSFQFASGVPVGTGRQTQTDDSTGQKMKLFQFKASSQPVTQFPSSSSGVPQPNSQPDKLANPIFPTNQSQVQNNMFTPQGKQTTSLFPQQQQQPSNFGFSSPVIPGPSMFSAEPTNPSTNLFNKQTNVFSPSHKSTFAFSATGNTPHTPTAPFAFTGGPQTNQHNTPTTPQTPTYPNFNIGSNQPSSDVSKRVIKTAKRRLHQK